MRILIGGIGYRHLQDHSFGVLVVEALAARAWPSGVSVEDVSYGPIALVQRLEDEPPDHPFELAIIVGSVARAGRGPGTLSAYRWDGVLPGADEIQTAVGEAVTGVIALDTALIVTRHFRALPAHVLVVEIEPQAEEFGDEMSEPVARAFPHACELIVRAATEPSFAEAFPVRPLGGGAPRVVRTVLPRVSDAWIH